MIKKFIVQVLKYGLVFILFSFLGSQLIYYVSGDNKSFYEDYEVCLLNDKLNIIKNHKADYNTIFFGTSKTFRHVNPRVFDSIAVNTRTFNAGISNLYPYRSFDFIAKVFGDSIQYDNIFIELSPLGYIGENYDAYPNINSINPHRYISSLKYPFQVQFSLKRALTFQLGYTELFVYKYLGFGIAKRVRLILDIPYLTDRNDCIEVDFYTNNGYYSLDDQLQQMKGEWNILRSNYENFKKTYSDGSKNLKESYNYAVKEIRNTQKVDESLSMLFELIKAIEPFSKRVIFIIPPRTNVIDIFLLNQQKALLEKAGYCVFDFSNPTEFPELYEVNYSFDESHLNAKGANLYSSLIALEFANKIDACP